MRDRETRGRKLEFVSRKKGGQKRVKKGWVKKGWTDEKGWTKKGGRKRVDRKRKRVDRRKKKKGGQTGCSQAPAV
jgi:hypothetical protein